MRSQIPTPATDATAYANKSQQFDPEPPQFGNATEVLRDGRSQYPLDSGLCPAVEARGSSTISRLLAFRRLMEKALPPYPTTEIEGRAIGAGSSQGGAGMARWALARASDQRRPRSLK